MIKSLDIAMATCGGKIVCRRCKALSIRTKKQCGRPAIKGKGVCQFHGGRSTGPKSEQSKQRLRTLNLKEGFYTAVAREQKRLESIKLRYIEDLGYHLGILPVKTKGRKPRGYIRFNLEDKNQLEKVITLALRTS